MVLWSKAVIFAIIIISTSDNDQTLVMYSGHPFGIFPSAPESPRCIITNGKQYTHWEPFKVHLTN